MYGLGKTISVFEGIRPVDYLYSEWGGGKKGPQQFFPVTSPNVRITTQNVLTFSFNPFATLL